MALTPLAIRKTRFSQRLRGYDPEEVDELLGLVADELTASLSEVERLRQDAESLRERLKESEERERRLQDTLVRAQKISDELMAAAQREAQLLVKEAEETADRVVQQAVDQAQHIEARISDLRHRRRELLLRSKSAAELFARFVESELEEERSAATVHTLSRTRYKGGGGESAG